MKLRRMAVVVTLAAGLAVSGSGVVAADEPVATASVPADDVTDLDGAVPISSSSETVISPLSGRPETQGGDALVRVGGVLLLAAGTIGFAARRRAQADGS